MSETMGYTDAILDDMDEIAKHNRDGGKVVRGLIAELRKTQRERDEARKTALVAAEDAAVEALAQVRANERKAVSKGGPGYSPDFRHAALIEAIATAVRALAGSKTE